MRLYGIDVTSRPSAQKPLAVAVGEFEAGVVEVSEVRLLADFGGYEAVLASDGPWVAAIDHPFGLPAAFVAAAGWPAEWEGYVAEVAALGRTGFRLRAKAFTNAQPPGRKYLRRATEEVVTFATSPLNVTNPPVGLMFAEGAPRLASASGVSVLPCRPVPGADRVAVEGYPACVARRVLDRAPYKGDRGGAFARRGRAALLEAAAGPLSEVYGARVEVPAAVARAAVDDVEADAVDAVLCLLQAAWGAGRADRGVPASADPAEGWIADPM